MAITVQSGTEVMTADSEDITITAVDLTRSYVIVDATTDSATSTSSFQSWGVTAYLADSTTITIQRDGGVSDASVQWQVVTCDQGEFIVVARGAQPVSTGNTVTTVTVPDTDPGRAMLIYNSRGNFGTTDTNLGFVTGHFSSPTELQFERGGSSTTRTNCRYEVIEWSLNSGVRVTSGVHDGSGLLGSTPASSTHGNSDVYVNVGGATDKLTNTWLFAQSRHEQNGLEQCAVYAWFDATKVYFQRYDHATANYDSHIAWQLVTFPSECCELRTPSMASGDTVKDNTTTLVMDTSATAVWQTNSCNGTGQAFGRNAWKSEVLNSTTIRQTRSYSGQACYSAISICDFSLFDAYLNQLFMGTT